MANFKKALEALASDQVDVGSLSKQLDILLESDPQHANQLLADLEAVYEEKRLNNAHYIKLKAQINQYRREHAPETESSSGDGGNATVFDQSNIVQNDQPAQTTGTTKSSENTQDLPAESPGDSPSMENTVVDPSTPDTTSDTGEELAQHDTFSDTAGSFDITSGDVDDFSIDLGSLDDPSLAEELSDGTLVPETASQPENITLGTNSVIKQRFKLLKTLGVGGMGKVYMGLDLLKEEARDKKPYVAIKLLNEDFKDHPEAFISLQREASRQQKLAHPNIATIYDFDRVGGPNTPVFITMELMEGMELKDFIKKTVKKQNGLPFNEAFEIIKQLGAALAYAHERRLAHSDFKPGNCFLCNDGTVKVLDFGIARAVKNPVTGEAEKTLFDPGQLGALTPAYASAEMLEGEEPDTRDDIYALGCVAYELLIGIHPFKKLPANKAKAKKLRPPIIKKLKRKQNLALQRSIAFDRKDRSPTVQHFLNELEAKYIWYKHPPTIAALLLLAVTAIGIVPTLNHFHQQEIKQVITDIHSDSPQVIVDRLAMLGKYSEADQGLIYDQARVPIQDYFESKIASHIDIASDDFDFPKAYKLLDEVSEIYPGSSFVNEQKMLISSNQKQLLGELYVEFSNSLEDSNLLGQTREILDIIKTRVDPENPLLTDMRPGHRYRILADEAFARNNLEQALSLITSGIAIAPNEERLVDTKTKIERAISIAEIQGRIGAVAQQIASLDDYKPIQSDVVKLAGLNAKDPLLASLSGQLKTIIDIKLQNILQTKDRTEADGILSEYGELLSALQLNTELTQLKLAHLTGPERDSALSTIVNTNKTNTDTLLATPELENSEWETTLLANIGELDSLTAEDPSIAPYLSNIRNSVVQLYLNEVTETLQAKRFDLAKNLVERSERFAPNARVIFNAKNDIAVAQTAYEKQLRVEGLKKDFNAQVDANNVAKAIEYFELLKADIPDDVYVIQEAPALLSSTYERLAQDYFDSNDYANALKFADAGLRFNPQNSTLKTVRNDYVVEADILDLNNLFSNEVVFDDALVRGKIDNIRTAPGRFSEFRQNAIAVFERRINALQNTDESNAAILAQKGAAFFPGSILEQLKNQLQLKPWADASQVSVALSSGKLTEAEGIIQNASAELSTHPQLVALQTSLEADKQEANETFNIYLAEKKTAGTEYNALRSSKRFLSRAQSMWTDNPAFDEEEKALDELIATNKPAPKVIAREEVVLADDSATATPVAVEQWEPTDSGRACGKNLAGHGRRAKAICYDYVNKNWRGPLMVVVPTDEKFNTHFAISKYEISVGDYGKYCAVTKRCAPEKNRENFNNPITNITLKDAQAYAAWVSERTGKTYRLPTADEWEYAAYANGKQPKKDYNCRVKLGDKMIKGTGTVSVKSGQSNGWGLKNYIGNVQEWIVDGATIYARGGAFQDVHSKCELSLSRSHNGKADEHTGFRLILEEVG